MVEYSFVTSLFLLFGGLHRRFRWTPRTTPLARTLQRQLRWQPWRTL